MFVNRSSKTRIDRCRVFWRVNFSCKCDQNMINLNRWMNHCCCNAWIISGSAVTGSSLGPKRLIGTPLRSTRNLVKFHLMKLIAPGCSFFRNFQSGAASEPLTLIFAYRSNVTPKWLEANFWMEALSPGSWAPNWLQGNAITRKPADACFLYRVCSCW